MAQTEAAMPQQGPSGIGGWLVLPIFGLAVTPLRALFLSGTYYDAFKAFPVLRTSQATFIVLEALVNLFILVVAPIALLVFLFRRMRSFPRLYVAWAVLSLAVMIVDLILVRILFADVFATRPFFDQATVTELVRALLLVVIWVPYMLNSRRVANTFIN